MLKNQCSMNVVGNRNVIYIVIPLFFPFQIDYDWSRYYVMCNVS